MLFFLKFFVFWVYSWFYSFFFLFSSGLWVLVYFFKKWFHEFFLTIFLDLSVWEFRIKLLFGNPTRGTNAQRVINAVLLPTQEWLEIRKAPIEEAPEVYGGLAAVRGFVVVEKPWLWKSLLLRPVFELFS